MLKCDFVNHILIIPKMKTQLNVVLSYTIAKFLNRTISLSEIFHLLFDFTEH